MISGALASLKYCGSKFLACVFSFHINADIAASGYILYRTKNLLLTIIVAFVILSDCDWVRFDVKDFALKGHK